MLNSLFAGPFNTKDETLEHAAVTWGTVSDNVLVELSGQFWINDGFDPETGKEFAAGAFAETGGSVSIL